MDLAAYLGSVAGICTLGIGGIYAIVATLGHRIDDLRSDMNGRFSRLENQNDVIIGAVADLGSA